MTQRTGQNNLGSTHAAGAARWLRSASARRTATPARPSIPAPSIATTPRFGTAIAMAPASVRQRLEQPDPGTVAHLRERQRDLLHAALSGGRDA